MCEPYMTPPPTPFQPSFASPSPVRGRSDTRDPLESYLMANPILTAQTGSLLPSVLLSPAPRLPVIGRPRAHAPKQRVEGYIPRPPNAWILFRSQTIRNLKQSSEPVKMSQSDISKHIGEMWRGESTEVRQWYEKQADLKKEEHKRMYPGYKYQPVRKDTAVILPTSKSEIIPKKGGQSKHRPIALRRVKSAATIQYTPPSPAPTMSDAGITDSGHSLQHAASYQNPYPYSDFQYPSITTSASDLEAYLAALDETITLPTSSYFTPSTTSSYQEAFFPVFDDTPQIYGAMSPQWIAAPLSAPAAVSTFNWEFPSSIREPVDQHTPSQEEDTSQSPSSATDSSSYPSPIFAFDPFSMDGALSEVQYEPEVLHLSASHQREVFTLSPNPSTPRMYLHPHQ
ncbi:hypothetical protein P7C70_g2799, partial [Phenoliferia sp. Uapishka_3]